MFMGLFKQLRKLPVIGDYISQRNSEGLINYWGFLDNLCFGFDGIVEKMAKYFIGF